MKTRWKKQVFATRDQVKEAVNEESIRRRDEIQKEIENEIFLDTARQMIAVVLYSLHLRGWRKKRLTRAFKDIAQIYDFMRSGIMNGQKFDSDDCIQFIKDKYGIDLIEEVSVEIKEKKGKIV